MIFNEIKKKYDRDDDIILSNNVTYKFSNFEADIELLRLFFLEKFNIDESIISVNIGDSFLSLKVFLALSDMKSVSVMFNSNLDEIDVINYSKKIKCDFILTDKEYSSNEFYMQLYKSKSITLYKTTRPNCNTHLRKYYSSFVFLTSGSTSSPKLVIKTQKELLIDALNVSKSFELTKNTNTICLSSLSHVYGLCCGVLPYLLTGATVTIHNPFSSIKMIEESFKLHKFYSCTALPIQYQLLLKVIPNELSRLSLSVSAGNSWTEQQLINYRAKTNNYICNTYGTSETGVIASLIYDKEKRCAGNVGKAIKNVDIQINEPIIKMDNLAVGTIHVRSNAYSNRYYLMNSDKVVTDSQEWYDTGDLGCYDEENNIILIGRKSNMINYYGNKILPLEIEKVIMDIFTDCEVVVIGYRDKGQEIPIAFICTQNQVSYEEFYIACTMRISRYKIPKKIYYIDQIPYLQSGKVDYKTIKTLIHIT